MAKQALTATAQVVLPENVDVFEGVKRAESARNILLQAQAEIQKTFPDFVFHFAAGTYKDPNAPRRGRRSVAEIEAEKTAEAAKANGSTGATTAPAAAAASGNKGSQPAA